MAFQRVHVPSLSWRHPRLKQRVTHRFCCRECGERFIALRDDARFCSNGCKQANYRRRGAVSPRKTEKIVHAETTRGSDRLQTHIKDKI